MSKGTEKRKCCGSVSDHTGFHRYPCGKGASIDEGGKWYCRTHAPSLVKAKQEARHAKWDASAKARREGWAKEEAEAAELARRASHFEGLLAACEAALTIMPTGEYTPLQEAGQETLRIRAQLRTAIRAAKEGK